MGFSYRNNGKVSLQSQAFKEPYFYAFIFTTSCFVAKKGKFNKHHVLRKYNTHRNVAIITNVTVINITSRIKKSKDNTAQTTWQIPGKYLHLKIFKRM